MRARNNYRDLAIAPEQRGDPEGEMCGKTEQPDSNDPEDELPAPIVAANFRIKAKAVMDEIAEP